MGSGSKVLEFRGGRQQWSDDNPYGLTRREAEVAQWLCKGLPIEAIAAKLDVSPRTVEAHRKAISLKLRASSLAHMLQIMSTLAHLSRAPVELVAIEDLHDSYGLGPEPLDVVFAD